MRFILITATMITVLALARMDAIAQDTMRTEPRATLGELSESQLIEHIQSFKTRANAKADSTEQSDKREAALALLDAIEALLTRFPETGLRDEAQITRLETLARLARSDSGFVGKLLELTDSIAASKPRGNLASENAFYAVQAFVLGARLEQMPEDRRLRGTLERYKAFVEDFHDSPHRPVMWASLIRNLITLKEIDRAKHELAELRSAYADHAATRRAAGEVFRATSVGRPYAATFTLSDGSVLQTSDSKGKVLVVHFWATWSKPSLKEIPRLIGLERELRDRGLQLIGVNLDTISPMFEAAGVRFNMSWPQYHDGRGMESDVVIDSGVLTLPAYIVLDREGIVRYAESGEGLNELLKELCRSSSTSQPDIVPP